LAPYDQTTPWSPESVTGMYRFLNRVWNITNEFIESGKNDTEDESQEVHRITHQTIKKVTHDIDNMSFNTAISAIMEMVNELYKLKVKSSMKSKSWEFAISSMLKLLSPFAPHITEELSSQLDLSGDSWPKYDEKYLVSDSMEIVVQVNGKVRAKLNLPVDSLEDKVVNAALENDRIAELIAKKTIHKKIYIKGKLVSLVVS